MRLLAVLFGDRPKGMDLNILKGEFDWACLATKSNFLQEDFSNKRGLLMSPGKVFGCSGELVALETHPKTLASPNRKFSNKILVRVGPNYVS